MRKAITPAAADLEIAAASEAEKSPVPVDALDLMGADDDGFAVPADSTGTLPAYHPKHPNGLEQNQKMTDASIYEWPALLQRPDDPLEKAWAVWAYRVQQELQPVYEAAFKPLPDDPTELDRVVTQDIDGWLPRVAALAVKSEFYLQAAKGQRYPQPRTGDNGKPITAGERDAEYDGSLAGFRFVRNELDSLTRRLAERVRWSQSVRRVHGDAQ